MRQVGIEASGILNPDFSGCLGKLIKTFHHANSHTKLFDALASVSQNTLHADLVQVLEYSNDERACVLRDRRGFSKDLYSRARVPAGLVSQAGRAMLDPQAEPIALTDFHAAHDYSDDPLLVHCGARSGFAVKVLLSSTERSRQRTVSPRRDARDEDPVPPSSYCNSCRHCRRSKSSRRVSK